MLQQIRARRGSKTVHIVHHPASPELLRDQLDQVRASGIAAEQDEAVIGESSLASPVFDSYGEAVGAIGVVAPSGGDLERHDVSDLVRETARAVSRELGSASWPPRQPGQ